MQLNGIATGFQKVSDIRIPEHFFKKIKTGIPDMDRLFGSAEIPGMTAGSTISLTGTPGAGKSTLNAMLLQALTRQGLKAAVASGEESQDQIAHACMRLGSNDIFVAHTNTVEDIVEAMKEYQIIVVDSFQALRTTTKMGKQKFLQYAQDSLINAAKETGCILIFVLHITTTGLPKGGTDIIHAVDVNMKITVSDDNPQIRLVNVYKNRCGDTKEMSMQMTPKGLQFVTHKPIEDENPIMDALNIKSPLMRKIITRAVGKERIGKAEKTVKTIKTIHKFCKAFL